VVKSNLFLVGGVVEARSGGGNLKRIGGLVRAAPWLSALFLISALSLAGIPPLSGFWAKLALVRAGFEIRTPAAWAAVLISLAVSLLTLISMIKIWTEAFWKPAPESLDPDSPLNEQPTPEPSNPAQPNPDKPAAEKPAADRPQNEQPIGLSRGDSFAMFAPIVLFTLITVAMGVWPERVLALAGKAADQLLRSDEYIRAVLGVAPDESVRH
jgi:multicomponent Na+:H+ antiporter subunit D